MGNKVVAKWKIYLGNSKVVTLIPDSDMHSLEIALTQLVERKKKESIGSFIRINYWRLPKQSIHGFHKSGLKMTLRKQVCHLVQGLDLKCFGCVPVVAHLFG